MKNLAPVALALTLSSFATGRAGEPLPDDEALHQALVGTWRVEGRRGDHWFAELFNFREDGVVVEDAVSYMTGDHGKTHAEGKWTVEAGKILCQSASHTPEHPDGKKLVDTVIHFESDKLAYIDDRNNLRIARRTSSTDLKEPDQKLGFVMSHLALYQTADVAKERVPGQEKLSAYVSKLQQVCRTFLETVDEAENLDVIVALRPEKQVKIWFHSSRETGDHPEWESLRKRLEAETPCDVTGGPFVFAIVGTVDGGVDVTPQPEAQPLPYPQEWVAAMPKSGEVIPFDEMLERAWPTSPHAAEPAKQGD